jgi:hypothetical protein
MPPRDSALKEWWPTTQSLDLVFGASDAVADAVATEFRRFAGDAKVTFERKEFADLNGVFLAAPHFSNVVTFVAILPTTSDWTVMWNNSFLCNGYDALCWCLTKHHDLTTIHWSAHDEWTTFQSGSQFTHRAKRDGQVVERSVACIQQDRKWIFAETGEPLEEEDTAAYLARKKRDRLNEPRIIGFLEKLGAKPWDASFYSFSHAPVFLLSRPLPPKATTKSIGDLLAGRKG